MFVLHIRANTFPVLLSKVLFFLDFFAVIEKCECMKWFELGQDRVSAHHANPCFKETFNGNFTLTKSYHTTVMFNMKQENTMQLLK
jgi:hypothetical protein